MGNRIVETVAKNPREGYGLPFSTWSLRVLAGFISKEVNPVDAISHTEVRNILLKHGIRYRQSKITLGPSLDPEYHLKKRELKLELRHSSSSSNTLPSDSVMLLYEDEKGPIAAKTHGGYIVVSYKVQGVQGPKDKGCSECVWRIRSHQQPDVDAWIQKEDRKAVLGFYQTSGPKV